jgi:prephenate dehydrogenase
MQFRRISILGVGLLGGSLGQAVKAFISDCEVVGYGHRKETLKKALEFGAIDRAEVSLSAAVKKSDLVVLCTPVGLFPSILRQAAAELTPGTIVTDVGSTKGSVVTLAEQVLPANVHFVGSHPMAGSEKRGVEFARPDLFQNALCITTPTPQTNPKALATVERFWQAVGMRMVRISPEQHDSLLADVSHLPHALAAALIAMQRDEGLELAGKGFLDTTRVAGGDGALWRDILLDNRDNLLASLSRLRQNLAHLEDLVKNGRGEELAKWLERSATRRGAVLRQKLREVNPD